MNEQQVDIARVLASCALENTRITYPELSYKIEWHHPFGRGLGSHLWQVLNFCKEQSLPILTSILVQKGTHAPPDDAMRYINEVFGDVDIGAEQQRVFSFNWATVPALELLAAPEPEIDYSRIYAARMYGFHPDKWGMLGFSHEVTRDTVLEEMGNAPIYVVFFCSPHTEPIEGSDGRFTISEEDRGRVLGIAEVQSVVSSPQSHASQAARDEMLELWGRMRWEHGLEISRAWRFPERPWTREALPHARSLSWEVTRTIVSLTEEEKTLIKQYGLEELGVFGQERRLVKAVERDPMNNTYLAICEDATVLQKADAPKGTKLVKIGVSGDTDRRLSEINGHDYARIFGLSFRMFATQRWNSQREALGTETTALEWALENTTHASGEYFFMTDSQLFEAATKVKPPKRVR